MKRLLFLILIISGLSSNAQIKPFAGLELFSSNRITVWERGYYHDYYPGDMSLLYGVKYDIKKVQLRVYATTYMHCDKLASYKPSHVEYTCSASYRINQSFKLKLEHLCIHPIENANAARMKLFGGYTKLGVYWNLE